MAHVGIYIGDSDAPLQNIRASLTPWTRYLADAGHQVDLVGAGVPFESADERCTQVRMPEQISRTMIGKLYDAYQTCLNYCQSRCPDCLIQFWKYPLHAPAVTIAGKRTNTPTLIRLNGDVFQQHRAIENSTKQALIYLFNRLGTVPPRIASHAIAFGPYGSAQLQQHGANAKHISILPPAADFDKRFSPPTNVEQRETKRKLGLSTDRTVVLYVGRVETSKGMDYLHTVVSSVELQKQYQFVLVGSGPGERGQPIHPITAAFNKETLLPVGPVPHERIHEYYRAADIYVHPSPYEGFPLVILESFACGLPILARPAGDIAIAVPTENLVEDPIDMVRILRDQAWITGCSNPSLFNPEYQQEILVESVDAAIK